MSLFNTSEWRELAPNAPEQRVRRIGRIWSWRCDEHHIVALVPDGRVAAWRKLREHDDAEHPPQPAPISARARRARNQGWDVWS